MCDVSSVQFGTATTRRNHVQWSSDAVSTYLYREKYPSYWNSREYWESGPIVPKNPDPPEIIRICEVRARKSAKSLRSEVNSSVNETVSSNAGGVGCPSDTSVSATLTVGTDCSGMDVPILALQNLGVNFKHVFSSDNDEYSKEFIMKNFPPSIFYDDIKLRDNYVLDKNIDVYMAGFPCQPFSVAGYQKGLQDPRGKIINHVLRFIENNKPKLFVLENVKGFTTLDNGKYVSQTLNFLEHIQDTRGQPMYFIYHDILNTADHGVPQRRLRWYCVGISKEHFPTGDTFKFPANISCPSLSTFLGSESDAAASAQGEESPSVQRNLTSAFKQIHDFGLNPHKATIAVDVDASARHMTWDSAVLPCLTRSRYRGHWITSKRRRTTMKEMLLFQGIKPSSITQTCSSTEMGKLIGNAMSVNVVERLLHSLFKSVGLLPKSTKDRWASLSHSTILGSSSASETVVSANPNKATASRAPRFIHTRDTRCIIDSGASDHIIFRKYLSKQELQTIRQARVPMDFQTANALVTSTEWVDVYIKDLDITITAWVVNDAPPFISLGKLVEDFHATYTWSHEDGPIIRIQDRTVLCQVKQRCPFVAASMGLTGKKEDDAVARSDPVGSAPQQPSSSSSKPAIKSDLDESAQRPPPLKLKRLIPKGESHPKQAIKCDTEVSAPPPVQSAKPKRSRRSKKPAVTTEGEADPPPGPVPLDAESPLHREVKKPRTIIRSKHISSKFNTHNIFTHFPKCADCPVCKATKTMKAQCRIKGEGQPDDLPQPKKFADRITFDHAILNADDGEGGLIQIGGKPKVALVIQDDYSKFVASYPASTKCAKEVQLQVERFLGPGVKAQHAYSDNAPEYSKAMQDMGIVHDTSTPYRSETNGVAERAVRRVKEGTSACLVQSGLNELFWDLATECYCMLRNVVDILILGDTAWERKYGTKFSGPIIPFGAELLYKPSSPDDIKRTHKFGNKLLNGIFVGYVLHAGGGWTGDVLLIDQDEIHIATTRSECQPKRLKYAEVHLVMRDTSFRFPMLEYTLEQPGPRPPYVRPKRKPPEREVIPVVEQKSSPNTERPSDAEASAMNPLMDDDDVLAEVRSDAVASAPTPSSTSKEKDTWMINQSCVVRIHNKPRTKLFVPHHSTFPIPIEYVDVLRTTWTDLDEAALSMFKDIWTTELDKDLGVLWTGRTVFYLLRPKPPPKKMWAGEKLINAKKTSRPPYIDSRVWSDSISDPMRKSIAAEYELLRPVVESARKEAGISEFLDPDDAHAESIIKAAREKLALPVAPAMPTLRVYDERLSSPPYSPFCPPRSDTEVSATGRDTAVSATSAASFGVVTNLGSMFRTYDSDGTYRKLDTMLDNTSTTFCGSSVRSSSAGTDESDVGVSTRLGSLRSPCDTAVSAQPAEPVHFRHHHDSYDKQTQQHLSTGDVVAEQFAMVHLPIPMKKAMQIPKAKDAVTKEWDALEKIEAWDLKGMKPKSQVIAEANKAGKSVHFGSLMDLCHEKGAEFNRPDHEKIYKGRVVFRGDQVRDETGFYACFTEQSATASHMAAIKFMDYIGRLDGNISEDSDAVKAYTQVKLDSLVELLGEDIQADTWITLPRERRPRSWDNVDYPVCPLRRNLYGHPLAGLIWEKHCQKSILTAGFEKIPGWECLFVHRAKKLFLSVYVDDFRMAGVKCNMKQMWNKLKETLLLEEAVDSSKNTYLGCNQHNVKIDGPIVREKNDMFTKLTSPHVDSSVDSNKADAKQSFIDSSKLKTSKYSTASDAEASAHQTANPKKKKKKKGTPPAVATSSDPDGSAPKSPSATIAKEKDGIFQGEIKAWVYDMKDHTRQCIERYLELANIPESKLTKRSTPCLDDHQLNADDANTKGTLEPIASRVVLKILYTARLGRPDTLWSVNTLARKVTKWTKGCDKRLHRLIEYLKTTNEWVQLCYVGDHVRDCWIALYVDASFAGDLEDSKSTNGAYLCIVGPRTFVPVTWVCKRQTAVSHSSTEAEVISLDAALRMEGLPCLLLWELIMEVYGNVSSDTPVSAQKHKPQPQHQHPQGALFRQFGDIDYVRCTLPMSLGIGKLIIFEDNDAVIKQCIKGRSPAMRHVSRTHRVDLDWLWERIRMDPGVNIKYVGTKDQIADIFTKGSFSADQWGRLCRLAQIGTAESLCSNH